MASRPEGPFILEVTFEHREDGGLRAYCDKVPGFVLSHQDAEAVMADVEPALSTILSAMYGMDMVVRKAVPMDDEAVAEMPVHLCGPTQYIGISNYN